MATEGQYKTFKDLYDEEGKRYSELDAKAKLYITIITFYLGAVAFKFKDVLELTNSIACTRGLYLAISLSLVCALLCTIIAMRVRTFEGICDPEEVIASFGASPPSDDDFRDDRIADLAVATNRNFDQNNKIARNLSWASFFVFLAALIQFSLFAIAIYK
jgi:hypothetical protein